MTPTRQAALTAAIEVWSNLDDDVESLLGEGGRILRLADLFEAWLSKPEPAVRLILNPGDIRPITKEDHHE